MVLGVYFCNRMQMLGLGSNYVVLSLMYISYHVGSGVDV